MATPIKHVSFHAQVKRVTFEEDDQQNVETADLRKEASIKDNPSHWTYYAGNNDYQVVVARVLTCFTDGLNRLKSSPFDESCIEKRIQIASQMGEIQRSVSHIGAERYLTENIGELADRVDEYVKTLPEEFQDRYAGLIEQLRDLECQALEISLPKIVQGLKKFISKFGIF